MHERFHYHSLDELKEKLEALKLQLPLSENLSALAVPLEVNGKIIHNRLAIHPMEGCDANEDGTPSQLTKRRYDRFVRGGAGLIWFEAVSTTMEGRASAHQLRVDDKNLPAFQRMVEDMRETGLRENGFEPVIIMQATHSGRYSKPNGYPEPLIAYSKPLFEKDNPIPQERILTDDQLDRIVERFGDAAQFAERAGFDGMDVKCCHGYLGNELMGAFLREGRYGGSFENRSRFLLDGFRSAKSAASSGFIVTTRLGVYDGFPYPYGFGSHQEAGSIEPDLTEPIALLRRLHEEFGLPLANITLGNPYVNPHVNRPYDHGNYLPEEHPLQGVERAVRLVSTVQRAIPELPLIATGLSYLRSFAPNLAAGMLEQGGAQLAGFGRMAFANPDFPKQILSGKSIDASKVCVACGACAAKLRAGQATGCVVRDNNMYCALK